MSQVLVTGATGFVGGHLVDRLLNDGHNVRALVRNATHQLQPRDGLDVVAVGELNGETDFSACLDSMDVVMHLAARVHQMSDQATDPLAEFRRVNRDTTIQLFNQAREADVRRFIYLSSVKAAGEGGRLAPLSETDDPKPGDAYGISKQEAEAALQAEAKGGPDVVILRPPLIYGPGAKGNILKLMQACDKGLPLPFGSVSAKRSLLYVGNLVDAMVRLGALDCPASGIFYIKDGADPSVSELIRLVYRSLGQKDRSLSIPESWLRGLLLLLGKGQLVNRLLDSLQVDDSKLRHAFGWTPPFDLNAGLTETAAWFHTISKETATKGSN